MPKQAITRASVPLELVHSDICGPMRTATLAGSRYFVTFIDDCTRFTVVYPLKSKGEVFHYFKLYKAWAELQTSQRIRCLRSDGGGEYISKEFDIFLQTSGITRQRSPPYTPQHNGVAERMNRTLMEMVRTMLYAAGLPPIFWGEALSVATYLRNRSPTRALVTSTPYQAWTGKLPELGHLRVFGCKAYVRIPNPNVSKLDSKAWECIFIGYSSESKAYRFYHPETKRIIVSRDAIFSEGILELIKQDPPKQANQITYDSRMSTTAVDITPTTTTTSNLPAIELVEEVNVDQQEEHVDLVNQRDDLNNTQEVGTQPVSETSLPDN